MQARLKEGSLNSQPHANGTGSEVQTRPPTVGVAKELRNAIRWCCAVLSLILVCVGGYAVFESGNELGTASLLILGAFFAVVAALGHVPRLKWGDAEIDSSVAYWAGAFAGAERAGEEIGERLVDSPERQELLEDALRAVAAESWFGAVSAAHAEGRGSGDLPSPLDRWSRRAPDEEGILRQTEPQVQRLSEEALAILERFSSFNPEADHFRVANSLLDLGFQGFPPQGRGSRSKAAYLRWIYSGESRTVRLYQNSAGLISDSQPQFGFAATLRGAEREGGVHPKVRFYYASSDEQTVIDAARALKEFASSS